jgi:hypothetical protein
LWDPQNFVAEKFPDNGTLMPKHEEDGIGYEVSCDLFYCILIRELFRCLKLWIVINVSIAATCAQQ